MATCFSRLPFLKVCVYLMKAGLMKKCQSVVLSEKHYTLLKYQSACGHRNQAIRLVIVK